MYVDIPDKLKLELDAIALQRSQPGARVPLKSVIIEALEHYIQWQQTNEQGKEQSR
jgi:predicted transcriptional regulator